MASDPSANPQAVRWFREGAGPSALLGREPYFLLDRHWGRHDTLLVLRSLRSWVCDDPGRAKTANAWIDEALRELLVAGQPAEALVLFNDTHIALHPDELVTPSSLEGFADDFDRAACEAVNATVRAAIEGQLPFVGERLGVLARGRIFVQEV